MKRKFLITFIGLVFVVGFLLLTDHRPHILGILPYIFLLACPFLHLFMHGGHDHHENKSNKHDE